MDHYDRSVRRRMSHAAYIPATGQTPTITIHQHPEKVTTND